MGHFINYVDQDEILDSSTFESIENIFKNNRVNVLSHLALHSYTTDDNNNVTGALYLSEGSDSFDFSVAVARECHGEGAGATLLDVAFDVFDEIKEINPEIETNISVLHPVVRMKMFENGFLPLKGEKYSPSESVFSHADLSPKQLVARFGDKSEIALMEEVISFCKQKKVTSTFPELVLGITSVLSGEQVPSPLINDILELSRSLDKNNWRGEFLFSLIKNDPRYSMDAVFKRVNSVKNNKADAFKNHIETKGELVFSIFKNAVGEQESPDELMAIMTEIRDGYSALLDGGAKCDHPLFPDVAYKVTEQLGFDETLELEVLTKLNDTYGPKPISLKADKLANASEEPQKNKLHSDIDEGRELSNRRR